MPAAEHKMLTIHSLDICSCHQKCFGDVLHVHIVAQIISFAVNSESLPIERFANHRAERGILNTMIRKALDGETLTIYGKGDYLRDYVYVQDVAKAFLMAGANIERVDGQHFVLGSGHGHTLEDTFNLVAQRVALKTGQQVQVTHIKPDGPLSPIETRSFVADSSKFIHATGWRPSCSLGEGIDRTVESYL